MSLGNSLLQSPHGPIKAVWIQGLGGRAVLPLDPSNSLLLGLEWIA